MNILDKLSQSYAWVVRQMYQAASKRVVLRK